jgi:DNA polymerase-3 subunit delta'
MDSNWNILGHEWAVRMLRQHLAQPRHAYLFTGPRGVGRRTLAMRFAQALSCSAPKSAGEPCGECRDCKLMLAERHPDVLVVQALTELDPPGEPKEGGILKAKQVRELRPLLHLQPMQARYKVALFLRFHEANEHAGNALLKTLEEAPSRSILMLTAEAPESVLSTIASRCEVLRLRPVELSFITADLARLGLEGERAILIARLSGGCPGVARRLAGDTNALARRAVRLDELRNLLAAPRVARFAYAEKASKDKDSLRETLLIWLSYWRDVLLRSADAEMPVMNLDRAAEIESLAARIDLGQARGAVRRIEQSLDHLERSVNARLMTEVLLLDLPGA